MLGEVTCRAECGQLLGSKALPSKEPALGQQTVIASWSLPAFSMTPAVGEREQGLEGHELSSPSGCG